MQRRRWLRTIRQLPNKSNKISTQDDCESTWVLKTTLEQVTQRLTKNHIQGSTKSRAIDDHTTNENQP